MMVPQVLPRVSHKAFQSLLYKVSRRNAFGISLLSPGSKSKESEPAQFQQCPVRGFQTSATRMDREEQNVQTKVLTIPNPFTFITLKIKTLLMRGYFDNDFNEKEFLVGARQAIIYVSSKLAGGEITEIKDVLTQEGLQCVHKLFSENSENAEKLKIEDSDIMTLALNDLGFEYGEAGRKWAYALVICYCSGKDSFSRQSSDFNFEIMTSQPRIVKYSFCREYTPGDSKDWLVDQINHTNLDIYKDV